ncbi:MULTISPECIES: helix-turn-helix domain-containing protein [Flavobacterium]|uniref:Helix-turn-helix domain-containing protein n=1 Tax=Flavobacterium keumense TaxID=1306518 RepID=A0ABY8N277_9FLAO|nr:MULTISPECIES: helix-turn-helix domain-containing protein [Flavobacterium]WGK93767.1 helix-turn-helix domain-containing protein [Flavobacterium keumense]
MSLPRLHPDDLQELVNSVSQNVVGKLEELFLKKENVSEMQTFTIKDAAKILNKHETTVLRYIKHNLIKAHKPGKEWIITQESLTNYIDGK